MRRWERLYRAVGSLAFPREWWKRHGGEMTGTAMSSDAPAKELATLVSAGLAVRTRGFDTNVRGEGWVVDGVRFGVLVAMVVGFVACQGSAYAHPASLSGSSLGRCVVDFLWRGAIAAVGRRRDTMGALFLGLCAALCSIVAGGKGLRAADSPLRDVPVDSLAWVGLVLWTGTAALLILRVWSRGVVRRHGSLWWVLAPFALIAFVEGGVLIGGDDVQTRLVTRFVALLLFALIGLVRLRGDPSWAVASGLAFAVHGVGVIAWRAGDLGDGGAVVPAIDMLGAIIMWSAATLAPRVTVTLGGDADGADGA